MKESNFQKKLIDAIMDICPGSIIMKNDANYIQGIPDWTVLLPNGKWVLIECKKSANATRRPNQEFYISWANEHGYGVFASPENFKEVINDIKQASES